MIALVIRETRLIYRAVALCISNQRLLICRPPELDFWKLPGGRVHISKTLDEALSRKVIENVGTAPQSARLLRFVEAFFEMDCLHFHEVGYCF